MQLADYHVHSRFSDGKSEPEEIVLQALRLGLRELGFSDHSPSPQGDGPSWSMPPQAVPTYRAEIARLKAKYEGQLRILCGIEQDLDSPDVPVGYDYIIGSVHYLHPQGRWFCVDCSADILRSMTEEAYGGDPYALCEDYFRRVAKLADLHPNIIGHFDLVSKFIERDALFDPNHPRYRAAQLGALDALLPLGVPFEINTGAISRGCRTTPYPDAFARDYIRSHGGRLILCSDSHHASTLCYQFEQWEKAMTE